MLKDETPQDALIERVRAVQEEHRIAESEVTKLVRSACLYQTRSWPKPVLLSTVLLCASHASLKSRAPPFNKEKHNHPCFTRCVANVVRGKQMWPAIMGAVEWNKKAELMIEQALRHVKSNLKFLARWTKSDRAQIVLMVTMQEFCFVNQNFLKIYNRFCLLFYKGG